MTTLTCRWHQSIAEIPADAWEALVGADAIPFYRWRWLEALERSGSTTGRQGWQPLHLALWRGDALLGLAPLYLKGHSYGEFVFDQSFARLASDLGLRYYPKLLGMSPVSPVRGYRFLIADGEDPARITALLMAEIDRFCREHGILSCNFLYVDRDWQPLAEAAGCATWLNQQSLWHGEDLDSFEAYLERFNANQRRNIRRERKAVSKAGLSVTPLSGDALDPALLSRMHRFYADHCSRWGPWGSKYLSEAFFSHLAEPELRRHVVLFSAHRGDPCDPVAMSLCVHDAQHLWGRYWGSDEEVDCLHFEVCYYAPITWAIERGIRCFDPGAGGGHKRRRGFLAHPHASLHRWYDPGFDRLVRQWLPRANALMLEEIEAVNQELPYRAQLPDLSAGGAPGGAG
ncbi:N-acetyltransferase [Synechococcus sp. RSCCF101]|uniref:GNAT family N-acetyltransferase n=1 Tax=Synechococcus sp. RSCCF101 TaxID=2511069 RepID=UPI001244DDCD|nr:GNAT family N-acetyltransferase [Synechococcus sp. RSCCF101]QEY32926.1 N-acetyltransferase [Synechococcus sp. RSCCF101]